MADDQNTQNSATQDDDDQGLILPGQELTFTQNEDGQTAVSSQQSQQGAQATQPVLEPENNAQPFVEPQEPFETQAPSPLNETRVDASVDDSTPNEALAQQPLVEPEQDFESSSDSVIQDPQPDSLSESSPETEAIFDDFENDEDLSADEEDYVDDMEEDEEDYGEDDDDLFADLDEEQASDLDDDRDSAGKDDDDKTLVIPPEVAEKFPDIVELIEESQSMNFEERQYWIDVLPIMSNDQVENLRGILDNEQKQLAEAEKNYKNGMKSAEENAAKAFDEAAYLEKKRVREEAEGQHEAEEKAMEQDILAEIGAL